MVSLRMVDLVLSWAEGLGSVPMYINKLMRSGVTMSFLRTQIPLGSFSSSTSRFSSSPSTSSLILFFNVHARCCFLVRSRFYHYLPGTEGILVSNKLKIWN